MGAKVLIQPANVTLDDDWNCLRERCESEWGLEQEYRDTRITAIYEGTNTIQALDLLGRKILMSGGKILEPFLTEIDAFCTQHADGESAELVGKVKGLKDELIDLTTSVGTRAAKSEADAVGAAAFDYLMFIGYLTLGWCWARAAVTARAALQAGTSEQDYYETKLATADFYFKRMLPRTALHAATLRESSDSLMRIEAEAF